MMAGEFKGLIRSRSHCTAIKTLLQFEEMVEALGGLKELALALATQWLEACMSRRCLATDSRKHTRWQIFVVSVSADFGVKDDWKRHRPTCSSM